MIARIYLLFVVIASGSVFGTVLGQETEDQQPARSADHSIAAAYETELARRANLTWDGLASQLSPRPLELDGLDFDPVMAEFFGLVERELGLTDIDIEVLRKHGFVLKDSRERMSFPGAYYSIYTRDLPLLITTDSILHAFHHSYDKILMELETTAFAPQLNGMLSEVHEELRRLVQDEPAPELAAAYRDVDFYLTVARRLLGDSTNSPAAVITEQEERINAVVAAAQSAADLARVDLFGGSRIVDFTQFKPRGHYTKTSPLKNYFRCMMWLGRADCGWNIAPTNPATGVVSQGGPELQGVALLVQLFKKTDNLFKWKELDAALAFFVGQSDNLNMADVLTSCEACNISQVADLCDAERLGRLQEAVSRSLQGTQRIRSQTLLPSDGSPGPTPLPPLFQLFGQRFALDSFLLSQVVHDAIEFQGQKVPRMMPTGLDVMAGMGNDLAVELLEPELRRWNYAGNLAALRDTVDRLAPEYWSQNLYTGWLGAIRQLDRDLTEEANVPQVFRTAAWQRKQLQTQLASWSELRHDTILYAKASYSVPQCEFPKAYVEPYPEFYQAMAELAQQAARDLAPFSKPKPPARRGFFGSRQPVNEMTIVGFFERMAQHLQRLQQMATKELRRQPFDEEETLFLQRTISQEGNVLFGSGAVTVQIYDGWYPQLLYGFNEEYQDQWQSTIADVHTDVQNGLALEVGVGQLDFCVAALEVDGAAQIYVGPTYSYYEFHHPVSDRMTDQQWQAMLAGANTPERPPFILPVMGSVGGQLEPLVQISRRNNRLMVQVDSRSKAAGRPGVYYLPMTGEGLLQLAKVAPAVRHLDLSGTQVNDEDTAPLKTLHNLKAVDFSNTKVTGATLAHVGAAGFLRRLTLKDTAVDDAALAGANRWPYLELLDLQGTAVTDVGLRQLVGLRYLRQLVLTDTAVTHDGVAALQQALPACRIEH